MISSIRSSPDLMLRLPRLIDLAVGSIASHGEVIAEMRGSKSMPALIQTALGADGSVDLENHNQCCGTHSQVRSR